jgi:hypothetical protein
MIISKFGKSYDTADGSEQHHAAPPQPAGNKRVEPTDVQGERNSAPDALGETRGNEGGTLLVQPPISPLELSAKPAWSVLSLRALNQAIRLGDWPDNPANLRRAEEAAEHKKVQARDGEAKRIASRAHAKRNRYRNPWENT